MVAVRNHIFPCHPGLKRVNLWDHTWTTGLKLRMKSKRVASQSKMAPTSHSSQKEAMRMVCSLLTSNANINLSPLSNNNNVYKHHLLFSTGQDCPALLHWKGKHPEEWWPVEIYNKKKETSGVSYHYCKRGQKMAKPALKPEDSRSLPGVLGLTQGLLSQIP